MATVQNVTGSVPVVASPNPPEGKKAASIAVLLTPLVYSQSEFITLDGQSGVALSQVCTLIIDNSYNILPVSVTHGALQEKVTVPAGVQLTVPTFSTRGSYLAQVQTAVAPASNMTVNLVLLNYDRPTSTIVNSSSTNASAVYSSLSVVQALTNITCFPAGNYSVVEMEVDIPGIITGAAGVNEVQIGFFSTPATGNVFFHDVFYITNASGGGIYQSVTNQWSRTFPVPLALPRNASIIAQVSLVNINTAYVNINMSVLVSP